MDVCTLLGNGRLGWWGGHHKQDGNEPVLINECLISYSALSGHGKGRGADGECWEEFMRKCRPSL